MSTISNCKSCHFLLVVQEYFLRTDESSISRDERGVKLYVDSDSDSCSWRSAEDFDLASSTGSAEFDDILYDGNLTATKPTCAPLSEDMYEDYTSNDIMKQSISTTIEQSPFSSREMKIIQAQNKPIELKIIQYCFSLPSTCLKRTKLKQESRGP